MDKVINKLPINAYFVYYITIALYVVASFFPEERLWGVNTFYYISFWDKIFLLAIVLIIPVFIKFIDFKKFNDRLNRISWFLCSFLLIPYLLLLFYIYSVRTYFLGDGYLLIANLETGNYHVKPWDQFSYLIQKTIYGLLGGGGEKTAIFTFQLISYLSGFIFLITVFWIVSKLYCDNQQRLFSALYIISGGYMILFFGYAENYPLFVTSFMVIGLLGLLIIKERINRYWIILPVVVASLIHPFAIALLPGIFYLMLIDTKIVSYWNTLKYSFRISILMVSVSIILFTFIYYYTQSDFIKHSLLPLSVDRVTVDGYWMFSIKHIIDYANLLLQLVPALFMILVMIMSIPIRELLKCTEIRFISLLIIPSLILAFCFDPKLGMARDWDLFSFTAIPLVLFAVVVIDKYKFKSYTQQVLILLFILLNTFILNPRVLSQSSPDHAIEYFKNIAKLDRAKYRKGLVLVISYLEKENRKYEAADLRVRFQQTYPEERWFVQGRQLVNKGKYAEGVKLFQKVLKLNPTFYAAWSNIGVVFSINKQFDSALVYMKIADGINPFNADSRTNIGGVYLDIGKYLVAEKYWKDAAEIDKDHLRSRMYLLEYYKAVNQNEDYIQMRADIAMLENAPLKLIQEEVEYLLKSGDIRSAQKIINRSKNKGITKTYLDGLLIKYPELRE